MSRPTLAGLGEATFVAAAMGAAAATFLSFAGLLWWWADLGAHFRVQYLAGSTLLLLCALVLRRWRIAAVLASCVIANGAVVVPVVRAPDREAKEGVQLRVVSVNVHTAGRTYDRVTAFLSQSRADVVLLIEVDQPWLDALRPALEKHAWRAEAPRTDNFGIALYSRYPCPDCQVKYFGAGVPSIDGHVQVDGRILRVLGTHPLPPVTAENAAAHRMQLARVAARVAEDTFPQLLMGDLNTTPWSARYRALLRDSRLSRAGGGLRWTWPAGAWPLGIEIDHALVSSAITARAHRGPDVGSDHYPLVAEISWSR